MRCERGVGFRTMISKATYRYMRPGEERRICDLIHRVFDHSVAGDFSEDGVHEFNEYARADKLAQRVQRGELVLVAELDGELAGVIEMRNDEHVAMLFVEPRGGGLGQGLFERALGICRDRRPNLSSVSVHSSRYAVPFYERLGFRMCGPETIENGIVYIPMVLTLSETADQI